MSRRILIVDDDAGARTALEFHFRREGWEVRAAGSAEQALGAVHEFRPDLVLTDVHMGGMSGLELLQRLSAAMPGVDVIVMTGYDDMGTTIQAMRGGAYDFLAKPLDLEQLDLLVARCLRDRAARARSQAGDDGRDADEALAYAVGRSPRMIEIYKLIGMVAGTRAPVLIRGETGTGKELVAGAIHQYGPWADEPFVAINCTAMAESLLESELFGHVKGAFTGADRDRKGKFELAANGTIFLDEIGDTSPAFQAKLLRVIQQKEFHPVGGEKARRTNARVIAATHRNLEELVRQGKFREDLYFRLRVVEMHIPPLRERRDDVPALAQHLLARVARELGKEVRTIPPRVMQMLVEHDWPGNVREMENAILRAAVLARGHALLPEDFDLAPPLTASDDGGGGGEPEPLGTLAEAQRRHVDRVLAHTRGNKSRAARILGISRPRLDRLLAAYASGAADDGEGES
ncbi:MAG TPA: sigma-54 dependent transcriptional regulator [Longimicrobium sp.]|nr:sigma-54 dependent transcriptional regulator [Longimicrobium sp.]